MESSASYKRSPAVRRLSAALPLVMLALLPALLHCSTGSEAGLAPAAVNIHDLYTSMYPPATELAKRASIMKAMPVAEYYQSLLASTSDRATVIEGVAIANSHAVLVAQAAAYAAIGGKYATMGEYWRDVKYDPEARVSEATFTANLRAALAAYRQQTQATALSLAGARPCKYTSPVDGAIFYTGITFGKPAIQARNTAEQLAKDTGGSTIFDAVQRVTGSRKSPPESFTWASADFARCAKGQVTVVLGDSQLPDNVWINVEFPALKNNPEVTKVIAVDAGLTKQWVYYDPQTPSS